MCIIHRWNKWETYQSRFNVIPYDTFLMRYTPENSYKASELRQRRFCDECGKIQDKLIRKG
jgi:hypothetical protein